MVNNESNKPDDVKVTPENEQAVPDTEAPAPEMTAKEAATLAHEGKAALREMGEEQLEPPALFDSAQHERRCFYYHETIFSIHHRCMEPRL